VIYSGVYKTYKVLKSARFVSVIFIIIRARQIVLQSLTVFGPFRRFGTPIFRYARVKGTRRQYVAFADPLVQEGAWISRKSKVFRSDGSITTAKAGRKTRWIGVGKKNRTRNKNRFQTAFCRLLTEIRYSFLYRDVAVRAHL